MSCELQYVIHMQFMHLSNVLGERTPCVDQGLCNTISAQRMFRPQDERDALRSCLAQYGVPDEAVAAKLHAKDFARTRVALSLSLPLSQVQQYSSGRSGGGMSYQQQEHQRFLEDPLDDGDGQTFSL